MDQEIVKEEKTKKIARILDVRMSSGNAIVMCGRE